MGEVPLYYEKGGNWESDETREKIYLTRLLEGVARFRSVKCDALDFLKELPCRVS